MHTQRNLLSRIPTLASWCLIAASYLCMHLTVYNRGKCKMCEIETAAAYSAPFNADILLQIQLKSWRQISVSLSLQKSDTRVADTVFGLPLGWGQALRSLCLQSVRYHGITVLSWIQYLIFGRVSSGSNINFLHTETRNYKHKQNWDTQVHVNTGINSLDWKRVGS